MTCLRGFFFLALVIGWLVPSRPTSAQTPENALSYSDEAFITQLYQEVIASQRLAGLAVNQGTKAVVRQLGASVTDSLRQAREGISLLAKKKGVTISDELSAQNQGVVDDLSGAAYDDFDRTYLDILLNYLPRILRRCQEIASTTQDPDLKAVAARMVSTIETRIAAVQAAKSES
jgi:predicted outer membrane protein